MRFISATRLGQTRSVIAVNFKPTPPLGIRCCTTASILICPSRTRKSNLAFSPTGLGVGVERNSPPRSGRKHGKHHPSHHISNRPTHRPCLDARNHSSGVVYFCQRGCHVDLL